MKQVEQIRLSPFLLAVTSTHEGSPSPNNNIVINMN